MPEARPVVVTGFGIVTPFGIGIDVTWDGIAAGVVPLTTFDGPDYDVAGVRHACAVDGAVVADRFSARDRRQLDRATMLGISAADDAVKMAKLVEGDVDRERAGIVVGSAFGGLATLYDQASRLTERGFTALSPFAVPMLMPNALAAQLSIRMQWSGPARTVAAACASGAEAIACAVDSIRTGELDVAVAGGADAAVTPWVLAAFNRAGALARPDDGDDITTLCRPFDRDRRGFVLGEGAAFLVLESMEHAERRGAGVLGEVAGIGRVTEAHHVVAPESHGVGTSAAMTRALADAGVAPEEVASINAHGTATQLNDLAEARGIVCTFDGSDPAVTSVKSVLGHSLGAAGAVEAVISLESARRNLVPPTHNHESLDDDIAVRVITGAPHAVPHGYVMSNSFAFGGHNVSLLLRGAA